MKLPLETKKEEKDGPVTCLGLTFENDDERRAYFTEILRRKLPELKKIEGYPIGEDEDILALSDPPYYTACPNPFLGDFIRKWEKEKKDLPGKHLLQKEPFIADVSVGKNDPIYMAHTYPTKVPHKAVLKYLLHYTNPGDIILDGFSGTGMTGRAASILSDRSALEDAGYTVDSSGSIYCNGSNAISRLGKRHVIMNDLSPSASFIAYNYNFPVGNVKEFYDKMTQIIDELEEEFGWIYETYHNASSVGIVGDKSQVQKGIINYVVWSDVFLCSHCSSEIVFWESAVQDDRSGVQSQLQCKNCDVILSKRDTKRVKTAVYDHQTQESRTVGKLLPVMINYSLDNSRYEKEPDDHDLEVLSDVLDLASTVSFPTCSLPDGYNTAQPISSHGFTHVHQLASLRNQIILGAFYERVQRSKFPMAGTFVLTAALLNLTWLYRWRRSGKGGILTGTYYVCSTPQENNAFFQLRRKLNDIAKVMFGHSTAAISVQASNALYQIPKESIDYIFTDPPFGSNLMYSELNFMWESWLGAFTNNKKEAIVNKVQNKGLPEYYLLMLECFKEFFRVLKPDRWMTVEFSNSQASIWELVLDAVEFE